MSTKSVQPENKLAQVEKQTKTVAKNEVKDPFKDLLQKLNEMEKLKEYYSKLKVKKDSLNTALAKMKALDKKGTDHFENNEVTEFPFQIVLRGEDEYNRTDDIFKINKRETVTRFTEYLLKEISEVLEVFEEDLLDYSKKINQ